VIPLPVFMLVMKPGFLFLRLFKQNIFPLYNPRL
jgi:hypothetical protein